MRRAGLAAAAILAAGTAALAQTDDRSYLTAWLEDTLSDAGRQVVITGFEGALSARATAQRIQISDAQGVWITLDGVVLDWTRSSLLAGEVVVNELTADRIVLERWPQTDASALPSPEAAGFSLPELPVSVRIGQIAAEDIQLGPTVLGQPVGGRIRASLTLADGAGQATADLERTDDGPNGRVTLDASFVNETGQLRLALDAREDAGGIATGLLGLPGRPAVALTVLGSGTLDDFGGTVRLESDGVERLAGPIALGLEKSGARTFMARLEGDPAPLFLPDYAGFLGNRVTLDLTGRRFPAGGLELDRLTVSTQALTLSGRLKVAADGLPQAFDLSAKVGLPDGQPVALPLPGQGVTRVSQADLTLGFDAAKDSLWSLSGRLAGLEQDALVIAQADLSGSGHIGRTAGQAALDGTLDFALTGAVPRDPDLALALGQTVLGKAEFSWHEGDDALSLPHLALTGDGYSLDAALAVQGLSQALNTTGWVEADLTDFARLSGLAGRPLGGAGHLRIEGEASALSGAFDLAVSARTQGLRLDQPQADRLLAGQAVLTASLLRDETGTRLRALDFGAASLRLTASGKLASSGSALDGQVDLGNLGDLSPGMGGALAARFGFSGTPDRATITLDGTGQSLRVGQAEVDRVLAGRTQLAAEITVADGRAVVRRLDLQNPQLRLGAKASGGTRLAVDGRLANLGLLVPEFPGPLTLTGSVEPRGTRYAADLRLIGPGGIDGRLQGEADAAGANLTLRGTSQAAVANGFLDPVTLGGQLSHDLRLNGRWALSSLTGRVTLAGGTVAIPARGLALDRVALAADLSGGQARVTATAEARRGGRLRADGTVALMPPLASALDIRLDGLVLRDPQLFETSVSGSLALNGPLLGRARLAGDLSLGLTELRVPSTGFATAADLAKVRHRADSAEVRATRARAGVNGGTSASGGRARGLPDWSLDIGVSAPNRLFLRGRGLDAELDGSVRLGGTLRDIQPSGGLQLIRGRLDLLGKRLVLSEAQVMLEGNLVPFLRVVASNETDGVISTVTVEGPATAPQVAFSSVPQLPQEEVLSWLLFGRGLETLSAFQAAQLANAVAVLAGRGGEGIVGNLRKGFGFDDLDVTTDDSGSLGVKAGKYVSEKVYTEVGVDKDGKTRINLNLDVKPGVTVKGRIDSDGSSGIGVFLEKDY